MTVAELIARTKTAANKSAGRRPHQENIAKTKPQHTTRTIAGRRSQKENCKVKITAGKDVRTKITKTKSEPNGPPKNK